jgi:hypothetical protein
MRLITLIKIIFKKTDSIVHKIFVYLNTIVRKKRFYEFVMKKLLYFIRNYNVNYVLKI